MTKLPTPPPHIDLITEEQFWAIYEKVDPTDLHPNELREYLYWRGYYDEAFFYTYFLRDWMTNDNDELVPSPPFHAELRAAMDNGNTVAIIPRGFGKTTNGKMRMVRRICYGLFQHTLFWMSRQLIETVLGDIREVFEDNMAVQEVFGNLVPDGTKKNRRRRWTAERLDFTNGCRITGISQWSAIRGGRYDEIWADDVQEDSDVHNPESAERFRHHFSASLMPSLKPGGHMLVTGTNVGPKCLVKQLYEEKGNSFQKLWYRAVENPTWNADKTIHTGEPLWPARFSIEVLNAYVRRMGQRLFLQEFQNETYVRNGAPVFALNRNQVRVLTPVQTIDDVDYFTNDTVHDAIWGIDLAMGKEGGDWSTIIGLRGDGTLFCQWRGKVPQFEVADVMARIWAHGHRGVVAPERNVGHAFLDACRGKDFYPSAMFRKRTGTDRFGTARDKEYGFHTSASSKRQLVDHMQQQLVRGGVTMSAEVLEEFEHYRFGHKGGMNASLGQHDDLLIAFLIAHWVQCFQARLADAHMLASFV